MFFINYACIFKAIASGINNMESYILYKKIIHLFSFILLLTLPVAAQYDDSAFVRYTAKEGLSDNYITCLQQDDWGYLWIGTDVGLNRFDGNSFKNFYQGSANLPLPSSRIRNIKTFGPHQLGIIGVGGFQLLNTKDFSVRNYFIPDTTAFTTYRNLAWDAVMLSDNSLALTTASGFYVFDQSGKLDFRYDAYQPEDIGKKRILYGREIFTAGEKEYMVYTGETGLYYYNMGKKLFRKIDPSEKEWNSFYHPGTADGGHWITKYQLNKNEYIFLFFQKDSIVFYNHALKKTVTSPLPFHPNWEFNWQSKITMLSDTIFAINGATNGFYLFRLNRQNGKIISHPKKNLPSYKINSLFLDKDKRLWAGTSKGLLQQKLNSPFAKKHFYPPMSIDKISAGLSDVFRYKNRLYLFRYSRFSGLLILDTATMKIEKRIHFFGMDNMWNEIISVQMYHPDTLWLGTNAGLLWFDTKTFGYGKIKIDARENIFYNAILAPAQNDGYAWMCSHLGGAAMRYHIPTRTFTLFTAQTNPALPFNKIKNIAYDANGDVWFSGHSLARWNTGKQVFDTLITVYGGVNKFNDDILALSADSNGSLWLHNALNGLLEYRIKEKKFMAYTTKDGLPSDALESFSPVIDNILWIESSGNLTRFDTRTKKMTVYGQDDGLAEDKSSSRKIYFDTATRYLYMLCQDYVVKFPMQQDKSFDNSSELMVHELVVNNKQSLFNPPEGIQLKFNENNLTLHFSAIDFESAGNYQFAYKLNKAETWTDLSRQRNINFTGLPSGSYSIQLRATGKSGEQKLKEFSFIIAPPFWKTPWFFIGCGLLLAGTLYYIYRNRIKQIKQKANIDKLLAQTEMKALRTQMNPHFIFNSLNSIREMILNNENKEASHFLAKFAHLMRMTLDQSGQSFISLRQAIDYLQRYIEMEQIRNNHFTCHISVSEDLDPDETLLQPMLIQPFIENAIWHGITTQHKQIKIYIDFKKSAGSGGEGNQLVCIVNDNGIGIEESLKIKTDTVMLHHSVGIANIKNRIRLLNEKHKLQSSVTIDDKSNLPGQTETGTLVTLRLPLQITDE
jgi:ligand-binding sensor domain-containing protein/two-component sensor histidine kinase